MSEADERSVSRESDVSHHRWPAEAGEVLTRSAENAQRLERLGAAIKATHELKTALYVLMRTTKERDVYVFRMNLFPGLRVLLNARAPWLLSHLERLQDRVVPRFTMLQAVDIFSNLLIAERIRLEYPYRQAEPMVAHMLQNQSRWAFRRFFPG